ncbi:MAG: NAD-dependent epimerase/dehydratase family protein [Kiritimatiellae bacterium]|jgi:UDP-glucuronate 4-epimerase|nr:NAD-dependent epimerase/dehydratase family protein [Kiritimatiellia bacterium]
MKTYLITGVAGFIASRTAELLLEQGHTVVGVDNLNEYYDLRLKTFRLQHLARAAGADQQTLDALDPARATSTTYTGPVSFRAGSLRFEKLDIEDKTALKKLFADYRFDAVLNLAARAGVRYSMIDPEVYMTTNAMGTLYLMDAMRETGCKKLVLASTSSLYAGQPMPFVESLPVNTPISPYAASKKAAEMMAYSYNYLYEIDVTVVRYFTVFGPAGRPDMCIFRFMKWIDEGTPIELFGDGTQSRDFTYVDDIARGTIAALKPVGYEIVNLGGGNRPIDLNEVIAFIEKALGKKALIANKPFHKADIMETSADISKAGRLLGWTPEVTPEEGFQRSMDWYIANRHWLKDVEL